MKGAGEGEMQERQREQKAENAVARPSVRVRGHAIGIVMCLEKNLLGVLFFLRENRKRKSFLALACFASVLFISVLQTVDLTSPAVRAEKRCGGENKN